MLLISMVRTKGSLNKNVFSLEFILYNNVNKDTIIKSRKYRSIAQCVDDNQELHLGRHHIYRLANNLYKKDKYNNISVKMINNQLSKEEKLEKLNKKLKTIQKKMELIQ